MLDVNSCFPCLLLSPPNQSQIARHVLDVHRLAGSHPEADEDEKRVRPCGAFCCVGGVGGRGWGLVLA